MQGEVPLIQPNPQSVSPLTAEPSPSNDVEGDLPPRAEKQKHVATRGEHKFDRWTYAGVGYLANVAISLGAVYWVERTHAGQQFMGKFIEGVKRALPKLDPQWSKFIASKTFFLTGGFAVLAPMKMLEDRKVDLIKKWDRAYYGDAVDHDPTIQQSHRELEAAPKQSWSSIIASRIVSLVPFYGTVGLLWSNKSPLAKMTNSEYRAMDAAQKTATLAMEETNLEAFSKTMSKGVYFDRPIAAASRMIGKAAAKATGNQEVLARITDMEQRFPGMLKEGAAGSHARDPNHSALPYYFISEMITSAMVARGVYLLTRVFAPVVGKKQHPAGAPIATAPAIVANDDDTRPAASNDNPRVTVARAGLEHHDRTAPLPQQVAR